MKSIRNWILLLIFFVPFFIQAQAPSGTIKINETIYIDSVSISVKEWIFYASYYKNASNTTLSEKFLSCMPDSTIFAQFYGYSFYPAAYSKINKPSSPMVGLSRKQINDYCIWRTMMVNNHPENSFNVVYQLPTKEEYQRASLNGLPFNDVSKVSEFLYNDSIVLSSKEGQVIIGNEKDKKYISFRCVAYKKMK